MQPDEMFHPMDFIAEELEERGWTLDHLALLMGGDFGVQRLTLDFLEHSREELSLLMGIETSRDLARAFGVHDEFFLNLHTSWRKWAKAKQSTGGDDAKQ